LSASRFCGFIPRERAPGINCIGVYVCPRIGSNVVAKRNNLCLCRELKPDRPASGQSIYWLCHLTRSGAVWQTVYKLDNKQLKIIKICLVLLFWFLMPWG